MKRNKDRAILAAGLVALAMVAGACAEAAGPNESTVTNDKPVSASSTTSTTKSTTSTAPTTTYSAASQADVEEDALEISGNSSLDQAALATFRQVGVSCPSDDECIAAVQSACVMQDMGYTSEDIYLEIAMFPEEQVLPGFPNSAIPHIFGVANGGYCDGW